MIRRLADWNVTVAVVGVLLVAVPLLAFLQYRWLGQVSDAERQRLRQTWQSAADRLTADFDREIGRVFLHFQSHIRTEAAAAEQRDYRLSDWRKHAPEPQLVHAAWRMRFHGTTPVVERFTEEGTIASSELPAWLEAWRDGLRQECAAGSPVPGTSLVPVVLSDVPAIVVRLVDLESRQMPACTGHVAVQLNREFIAKDLLPRLVARHFGAAKDFHLAVLSGGDGRTVYTTDGTTAVKDGDVMASLLAIRFEELGELLKEGVANMRTQIRVREPHRNFVFSVLRRGATSSGGVAALTVRPDQPAWHLVVRHREGSLEAAVAGARLRNLTIGFGMLLLLVGTVGVLAVSTSRSRRLARQQMEFVAGVSHELRTPLSVIRSAGENLSDGVVSDPDQIRQYGTVIEREGRRLTDMVEQVLAFSTAATAQPLPSQEIDVARLVQDVASTWESALSNAGFSMSLSIDGGLPPVHGDPQALARSLHNLLSNAEKYSRDVRAVDIAATAPGSGREVVITVSDRGIGIAQTDLPHIFEPFYRGRDAIDAQIHGSGLGLSLVKQTVEAHGGRVSAERRSGGGMTFALYLPAAEGNSVAHAGAASPQRA